VIPLSGQDFSSVPGPIAGAGLPGLILLEPRRAHEHDTAAATVNMLAWCRGELDKKRPLLSMLRHSGTFLLVQIPDFVEKLVQDFPTTQWLRPPICSRT
jgi:hypothetical protein